MKLADKIILIAVVVTFLFLFLMWFVPKYLLPWYFLRDYTITPAG